MTLPILVSILALVLSGVSLGWNIYRDVILKARLRVNFGLSFDIRTDGSKGVKTPTFLRLMVVNMGPGEAVVTRALVKLSRFGKPIPVIHDFNDPSAWLPTKIGVSEQASIQFPIDRNCLLDKKPLRIGVLDSFGRIHWAPRRDLIKAHRDLEEHKAGRPWWRD